MSATQKKVLGILLLVAALDLAVGRRFGLLWGAAFGPHPKQSPTLGAGTHF